MKKTHIVKRNGKKEKFTQDKIEVVIERVFIDTKNDIGISPLVVERTLELINETDTKHISTEEINDHVQRSFMECGFFKEATSFILHREENKNIRSISADNEAMSNYIFMNRYARYNPKKKRRETWNEAVNRVRDMNLRKYPMLEEDIMWAFEQVRQKRVLPSMRSMQFGGSPIEENNIRMYNCSYGAVDRKEFFQEAMYLLLCGAGVGMSVCLEDVAKLPTIEKPCMKTIKHIEIEDSIEGWADSIKEIMNSYFYGYTAEFVYSKIRKQGSKISSGGLAPGHVPLRRAIEKIRTILDKAVGRKLKPIEAYDIVMHEADAVLAGGVRRSATICLFSPEDDEMINAKTGNWFNDNPQRGRSNNSVKLIKNETTKDQFMRIFEKQKEFGEPGFIFTHSKEYGFNPCVEIGMHPYIDGRSGISFCNLTTMNGKMLETREDFEIATKASAIIGTCQAGYTDFKYLSKEAKEIAEKDALLGVSITGIMDSPKIALDFELQKEMAELAVEENKRVAKIIGINSAARVTCVKPEGSTSILLDTASGIHPRFAQKYFRRIQANTSDPVYKYFKSKNPHCCEPSVWSNNGTDDVITFCVKAPKDAVCKNDIGAIDFLDIVKKTQESWVMNGNAKPHMSEGLNHNVSNTVSVNSDEWDDVADYIYENREYFSGISLLPNDGATYQQAPHEQIQSSDDEIAWGHIVDNYAHVDYVGLNEEDDNTKLAEAVACGGGACEIK